MKTVSGVSGQALRRAVWIGIGIATTFVALVAALTLSGSAVPREIGDSGSLVRWGLPASTTVHHLSLSVVLASVVFLLFMLPSRTSRSDMHQTVVFQALHDRLTVLGSIAAALWFISAVMVLVLGYADILGQPVSVGNGFFLQFGSYLTSTGPGQARAVIVLLSVSVATLLLAKLGRIGIALAGTLTLAAAIPLSMVGHSASGDVHWLAVGSLGLHIVGVSVWVGGVIWLGLLSDILRVDRRSSVRATIRIFSRFSLVAGIAFALVFGSGIINALTRLGDAAALSSPYGTLILLKIAATLGLGVIGYLHRRWISAATRAGRMPLAPEWRLVGIETLIMGATVALAVVLAQTTPPLQHGPDMVMGAARTLGGVLSV